MKTFITSDTHFYHSNTLKWDMRKSFSSQTELEYDKTILTEDTEKMNETLISNWNSVVGKNDLVYHLGDIGFASHTKIRSILERLNGKIHLIQGNHDKWKVIKKLNDLFVAVDNYKEIKHQYEKEVYHICMMHYPIASWNRSHYGSLMLHGHAHGGYIGNGKIIDVGVDTELANYYPLLLDDVIEYSKKLEYVKVVNL